MVRLMIDEGLMLKLSFDEQIFGKWSIFDTRSMSDRKLM